MSIRAFPFDFNYFSCLDCYLWELQIKFEWQFRRIQGCCMFKRSHTVNYTFSLLSSSSKCNSNKCGCYCCCICCCCCCRCYFCGWWWFWFAFDALTLTQMFAYYDETTKIYFYNDRHYIGNRVRSFADIGFTVFSPFSLYFFFLPILFLGGSTSHFVLYYFLRCSFVQHVFLLLTNNRLVYLWNCALIYASAGWLAGCYGRRRCHRCVRCCFCLRQSLHESIDVCMQFK